MGKQYIKATYNKDGQKLCTNCKNFKNFSEFHKRSSTPDGIVSYCKVCVKEYDKNKNEHKLAMPRKEQDGLIHCRKCEEYLDKSKFWGGLTYCKECSKIVGHAGKLKGYGLTVEKYIDMEKSQNNVCAICKNPEMNKKRLSVDHDHSCCSGTNSCGNCIRGLLCSGCNFLLGAAKDNIQVLQAAIKYLQK
jgi:hypothetical protein